MVPWDNISLRQFDKDLADLCPTVSRLILESLLEELKELFPCGVVDCLSMGISSLLSKNILHNVSKNLDNGLSQEIGFTVKEAKKTRDVLIYNFRGSLRQLSKKDPDVLDANCFVGAVVVEDLLS